MEFTVRDLLVYARSRALIALDAATAPGASATEKAHQTAIYQDYIAIVSQIATDPEASSQFLAYRTRIRNLDAKYFGAESWKPWKRKAAVIGILAVSGLAVIIGSANAAKSI